MKTFKLLYSLKIFSSLCMVFIFGPYNPVFAKESTITDEMVLIPGGVFNKGCNRFGPEHGAPEHKVHLDPFWIDKFEVIMKNLKNYFQTTFFVEVYYQIATNAQFLS